MENGSKIAPKSIPGIHQNPYFSRPCPKVDFWMHFGRPLAPFGLPFGSLWPLLGSLWLTFGSLWFPFGALLVPLGSLLLTSFFSLLGSPGVIFNHFTPRNWRSVMSFNKMTRKAIYDIGTKILFLALMSHCSTQKAF